MSSFSKILIANRGEIARRIIQSSRALGYRTVAVYSRADAESIYLQEADQAVCIGEALPAQSYLCIEALLAAAQLSGAEAVHPGYGFLAENPDFAEACQQAGLVFIGPSAEAIRSMGNKAAAKTLMQQAGLTCIPGWQGPLQSEASLLEEAKRLGFPLMIKAAMGGGGRGMRRVESAADFLQQLHSARAEAQSAFGNSEIILERLIRGARHIEIQILADRYGKVIHLGERDCSLQRRQQKLIEEAPSPAVNDELRKQMGQCAVQAVKQLGYQGVGTLEFLLDTNGQFYFMEMNTRLQVEHSVTEAITGLDLVALQLQIAAGEPLPLVQEQVSFQGHAIEARLCAEDVRQDFLPQSGRIGLWQAASRLRVDHSLASGCVITPYYDSMLAKFCAHAPTREMARRKLLSGLMDTVLLGIRSNQAFLQRCLNHREFMQGTVTTDFIGEQQTLVGEDNLADRQSAAIIAAALLTGTDYSPLAHHWPLALRFRLEGQMIEARLQQQKQALLIEIDGQWHELNVVPIETNKAQIICNGLSEAVIWQSEGTDLWLHFRGRAWQVEDLSRCATHKATPLVSDGKLRASMNGRISTLLAQVGDTLQVGQAILTLEAMKMEHIHRAPLTARLLAFCVQEGEQVAAQQILAEFETSPTT